LKLADVPDVEAAESPVAVVEGVVPDVTTEATMLTPVAGAFDDTLYVRADRLFHVPANLTAWYLEKLFDPAVTGDDE
jgi:hypothetical protein